MFEKLNNLRAERDNLSARLTLVNNEIAQEFARIDAEIVAKRKELGTVAGIATAVPKNRGGRPKGMKLTLEQRQRISRARLAYIAKKRAESESAPQTVQ